MSCRGCGGREPGDGEFMAGNDNKMLIMASFGGRNSFYSANKPVSFCFGSSTKISLSLSFIVEKG